MFVPAVSNLPSKKHSPAEKFVCVHVPCDQMPKQIFRKNARNQVGAVIEYMFSDMIVPAIILLW